MMKVLAHMYLKVPAFSEPPIVWLVSQQKLEDYNWVPHGSPFYVEINDEIDFRYGDLGP